MPNASCDAESWTGAIGHLRRLARNAGAIIFRTAVGDPFSHILNITSHATWLFFMLFHPVLCQLRSLVGCRDLIALLHTRGAFLLTVYLIAASLQLLSASRPGSSWHAPTFLGIFDARFVGTGNAVHLVSRLLSLCQDSWNTRVVFTPAHLLCKIISPSSARRRKTRALRPANAGKYPAKGRLSGFPVRCSMHLSRSAASPRCHWMKQAHSSKRELSHRHLRRSS
jgi:hypothetical protein